jgi:hypothetical protein
MRNVISTARARQLYGNTAGDERAGLCAHQVQAADRSLLTPRHLGLPIRMAPHHREPQPAQVHRTGPPPRAPDGAPVTSPAPNHFQHSQHRPTVLSQDLSNSHDQDRGHSAVELSVAMRDLRQQRGCHLARLPVVRWDRQIGGYRTPPSLRREHIRETLHGSRLWGISVDHANRTASVSATTPR